MKKIFLLLPVFSFCLTLAMEQAVKQDYLSTVPKKPIERILFWLMVSSDGNIAQDNNSIYFSDGYQNKDRKHKDILPIRNFKSLGCTCKHFHESTKKLLTSVDRDSCVFWYEVMEAFVKKFTQQYIYSTFEKEKPINGYSYLHDPYIVSHLNCAARVPLLNVYLKNANSTFSDKNKYANKLNEIKSFITGCFVRGLPFKVTSVDDFIFLSEKKELNKNLYLLPMPIELDEIIKNYPLEVKRMIEAFCPGIRDREGRNNRSVFFMKVSKLELLLECYRISEPELEKDNV